LSVSSYDVDLGTFAGTNLVVGQAVSHPGLLPGTYLRRQPYGPSSGWVSLSHLPTNAVVGAGLQFDAARFTSVQEIDAVECWSNATVTVNPAGDDTLLTFGSISGIGGLTKAGTGKLRLVGAVTFTGTNNISAGTLDFAGTANNTLSNAIVGAGTLRQSGTCTTTVDSATASISTFTGSVTVDGGALLLGDVINDSCGLNNAASYTVTTNGTLIVRRNAMSSGAVTLIGGTLRTDSSSTFQTLGAVTLNGGTLQSGPGFAAVYNGFAINNTVTVTGSVPSVIQTAAGAYNGIHLAFYAGAPGLRTFNVADVTGNANADLTVSAVLLESSHNTMSYGLTKTGAGTMVLTATNTYSGATMISNGTLLVSGGMPNSAVTVATNAAFGTAGATVSRVASLTLAEGSKVVWKYDGNAQTAGRINVTGTLTLPSAATLDVSGAGFLYSNQALFSAGSVAGATNLSGWTITGATKNARAAVVGNQVVLLTNRGTLIRVR